MLTWATSSGRGGLKVTEDARRLGGSVVTTTRPRNTAASARPCTLASTRTPASVAARLLTAWPSLTRSWSRPRPSAATSCRVPPLIRNMSSSSPLE